MKASAVANRKSSWLMYFLSSGYRWTGKNGCAGEGHEIDCARHADRDAVVVILEKVDQQPLVERRIVDDENVQVDGGGTGKMVLSATNALSRMHFPIMHHACQCSFFAQFVAFKSVFAAPKTVPGEASSIIESCVELGQ
ncbi:hypothetical protein [Pseudoduganella lutea]|uniref:Uncharacterized protein n=1 Tax=Pseudoduganella lutea TaxID=321985 RepID=A0A4P6L3Z6_9BURK|nr:hypothetical protein [Pseudoduganella lutea]QBE66144.1 hypothetical protein EWM63_26785 [Pseudoduganella lutea]